MPMLPQQKKQLKKKQPETFEEAFQNPKWIKAIEEEITMLERNQTWDLVSKPRDVKLIS